MVYFIFFIQIIGFSCVFLYGYVILERLWAWQKIPLLKVPEGDVPQTLLSVIVPVRNEEANIGALLSDLKAQTYDPELIEVLVIDDYSEDKTGAEVLRFAQTSIFPVHYKKLKKYTSKTGKKAAVEIGVAQATGELMVLTDGDCRVQPGWLRHIEYLYRQQQAKFISGLVCFTESASVFEKIQLVEFASLIGVGAGSLALKRPNMCNGANIAYTRQVFNEVNGFAGNEHIPSGDDEFLMHKVFKLYPEAVFTLKSPEAVVYTSAQKQVAVFFAQRVRWASKWPAYTDIKTKLLAVLVFSVNFFILLFLGLFILGYASGLTFALAFGAKCLLDIWFLKPVLSFFQKHRYWVYIVPLQFIYVPYVVITALTALKGTYNWKGRNLKT